MCGPQEHRGNDQPKDKISQTERNSTWRGNQKNTNPISKNMEKTKTIMTRATVTQGEEASFAVKTKSKNPVDTAKQNQKKQGGKTGTKATVPMVI